MITWICSSSTIILSKKVLITNVIKVINQCWLLRREMLLKLSCNFMKWTLNVFFLHVIVCWISSEIQTKLKYLCGTSVYFLLYISHEPSYNPQKLYRVLCSFCGAINPLKKEKKKIRNHFFNPFRNLSYVNFKAVFFFSKIFHGMKGLGANYKHSSLN